jgi:sterol desaturase/sphingolipid hydroxylase (fatty acid hydroxylase superfamily)
VAAKDRPIYYYGAVALVSVVTFFMLLPVEIAITVTVVLLFLAWANDWLHEKIHIRGTRLESSDWFLKIRELHHHHHVDVTKNIGIFSWFTDKLFKTYEDPNKTGRPRLHY